MSFQEQYAAAEKAGELKNLTPDFYEWTKKGDIQVGRLVSVSAVDSSLGSGQYNQYMLETDKGLVKFALGAATDKEIHATVIPGRIYAFIFDGKVDIGRGRSVNKFKVTYVPDAEGERVGGVDDVPF